MPSIVLPGEDEDLPPEEDEIDHEAQPIARASAVYAAASTSKSSSARSSESSSAKRQRPNPFDDDANPEAGSASEAEKCPVCMDEFKYPVVECKGCHQPMCHACLKAWSVTVNSRNDGDEKVAQCPACRSTAGYQEHIYLNRKLGRQMSKCEHCEKQMSLGEVKKHIRDKCPKTKLECVNRKFGCTWRAAREFKEQHEASCDFEKQARESEKRASTLAKLNAELDTLVGKKDEIIEKLEAAMGMAKKVVDNQIATLAALQHCCIAGNVSMFTKNRKEDNVNVTVKSRAGRTLDLQVDIKLDEDRFYALSCRFTDSAVRFPVWLAGFLLDPSNSGSNACQVFSCFFEDKDTVCEMFNEADFWEDREEGISLRSPSIQFGITASILYANDPRM